MFNDQQKEVARLMIARAGGDPKYAQQLAASDEFALAEIAKFKAMRLGELAVDREVYTSRLAECDALEQLLNAV
jgi:hypothetical protein